jgi:hypothetical protein
MPTTPEPLITLPLDLTIESLPIRVTRIGTDAVVYHELTINEATNELVRLGEDLPAPGFANFTDETTEAEIQAHVAADFASR